MLAGTESISVKDTVVWESGYPENYLVIEGKSRDSIIGLTAEQRVLAKDIRELRDFYQTKSTSTGDSTGVSIHLDRKVIKKMFEKAKFVNDMMMQTFRESVFDSPENTFDVAFLDSVIHNEFTDDKLPSNYTFVVKNEKGEIIKSKTKVNSYNPNIDTNKAFVTGLFPSNLFDEQLKLYVFFPKQSSFLLKEMWLPLVVNILLVLLIFWALVYMFKTILTQKKLGELKNDFISNMTHEFRTPISTISLACQAMNDKDMIGDSFEQTQPFVKMISDENKRLSVLVDGILQSSTIEKGEIRLKLEKVLVNEIIYDVVNSAQLRIKNVKGEINVEMGTDLIYVLADKMHFTNAISNLLDNAIKYSDEHPKIKIEVKQKSGTIKITVSDKGVGIKKEHQNKIFDKLYRIPTGNVHNVKGFGLGLNYVKGICEAHKWKISVHSKLGEGSSFTIEIKQ